MADKLLAEWFWTDRWMGSSAFLLPLEARGLYREMLTQAWRRGASLPKEPCAIQRACGVTPEEWARCWPLVKRYWVESGDTIHNETQRAIYAESEAIHDFHVKGGKARAATAARDGGRFAKRQQADQPCYQQADQPPSPSPSPDQTPEPSPAEVPSEPRAARAPRKRAAARTEGDPRINSLKTAWEALYATAAGEPPKLNHGLFGKQAKELLRTHGEDEIVHRANSFLASERGRMQGFRFEAFYKDFALYNGHAPGFAARPETIAAVRGFKEATRRGQGI